VRLQQGRGAQPSAGIADSQSVQTTGVGGPQGLDQATPEPPPGGMGHRAGPVRAVPILGGLHHACQRAA
jgi:hypothetical protein